MALSLPVPETIRRVTPADPDWPQSRDWFVEAYFQAVTEENQQSPVRQWRHCDRTQTPQLVHLVEQMLAVPDRACLLFAQAGGETRGYFLGWVKEGVAEQPGRVGYVNGLYVAPAWRGRGVGQRLLTAGNAWFREQRLTLVELYTAIDNLGARHFWERNGYTNIEVVMMAPLSS